MQVIYSSSTAFQIINNIHGRTHIGKRFQRLHLVKKAPTARHFFEMLGFIHNEGTRVAMMEPSLQHTTQIKRGHGSFNDELPLPIPAHAMHVVDDLVGHHGFIGSNEGTGNVVFPTEIAADEPMMSNKIIYDVHGMRRD